MRFMGRTFDQNAGGDIYKIVLKYCCKYFTGLMFRQF